jgi:hypothetical protein
MTTKRLHFLLKHQKKEKRTKMIVFSNIQTSPRKPLIDCIEKISEYRFKTSLYELNFA